MRHMIFGESHGPAIGVVVEGVPAGLELNLEEVQRELDRRKPGQGPTATARKESDTVQVLSGVFEGRTTGAPLAIVIPNSDQHSKDYEAIRYTPRPSHGDYAGYVKSGGCLDYRGAATSPAASPPPWWPPGRWPNRSWPGGVCGWGPTSAPSTASPTPPWRTRRR